MGPLSYHITSIATPVSIKWVRPQLDGSQNFTTFYKNNDSTSTIVVDLGHINSPANRRFNKFL